MDALREDILPDNRFGQRTILVGDFNLQIPPHNYPWANELVNQKREATFAGWHIPTAGNFDGFTLDKRFIDHIALTQDCNVRSMQFISRFDRDGTTLSDHNGVVIDVDFS